MQKSVTVQYCKVTIQENASGCEYGHITFYVIFVECFHFNP